VSAYGYYQWRLVEPLQLVAGLSYDWLRYPVNFRYAPLSDQEDTKDQWSPKAGIIWTPTGNTAVRGAYTRSLGGVSFDQSFRLEPTQVAGFNQAFRSLIPEAVAGANSAATFETFGASLEQRFGRGTYVGVSGEILKSTVDRIFGVYDFVPFAVTASGTPETLDYEERTLSVSLYQLVGNEWSFGTRYRFSHAQLSDRFPAIRPGLPGGFQPAQDWTSVLHQVHLFAIYNHRCGFFGELESLWNRQSNQGYTPERPGDDFWQFNAFIGYRWRQAEARLGLLNLTDQDYRLNPLNLTPELPRSRTLLVSVRFCF